MKKVLVVGATGAMGKYLVPELEALGYAVVGLTLDDMVSTSKAVTYKKGNAMDKDFLETVLEEKFDGIVDFMSYNMTNFYDFVDLYLQNTEHYIFRCKTINCLLPCDELSAS